MKINIKLLIILFVLLFSLIGCDDESSTSDSTNKTSSQITEDEKYEAGMRKKNAERKIVLEIQRKSFDASKEELDSLKKELQKLSEKSIEDYVLEIRNEKK